MPPFLVDRITVPKYTQSSEEAAAAAVKTLATQFSVKLKKTETITILSIIEDLYVHELTPSQQWKQQSYFWFQRKGYIVWPEELKIQTNWTISMQF